MDLSIVGMNFFYCVVGTLIALIFMVVGYKLLDYITPFKTGEQLEKGNVAVGIIVGSIFISLGVSVGLVVGMGLN